MSFNPISTDTGVHISACVFAMCVFVYMMFACVSDS